MHHTIRLIACIAALWQALYPMHAQAGTVAPNIVVSTDVLKPLIDGITQGIRPSQALFGKGQSPHSAQLKPSQTALLEQADIIIVPDRALTPALEFWSKKLEKRGGIVIELTQFDEASPLPYRKHNPLLAAESLRAENHHQHDTKAHKKESTHHDHDHDHHSEGTDPHLWLDPLRMANLMLPIAKRIAEYSPEHEAQLTANAQQMALHLRGTLMPELQRIIAAARPIKPAANVIPFITAHDAYQYFGERFGLSAVGFVTQHPEAYQGAKTIHDVMERLDAVRIRCIIAETPTSMITKMATLAHGQVVTLNPERLYSSDEVPPHGWLRNDYDRFMLAQVNAFAGCLKQ